MANELQTYFESPRKGIGRVPGPVSESGVTIPPRGPINATQEAAGQEWKPPAGDLYLGSQYYESADGLSEANLAVGEDEEADLDRMDRFFDYLAGEGIELGFADHGTIQFSKAAKDALSDFVKSEGIKLRLQKASGVTGDEG